MTSGKEHILELSQTARGVRRSRRAGSARARLRPATRRPATTRRRKKEEKERKKKKKNTARGSARSRRCCVARARAARLSVRSAQEPRPVISRSFPVLFRTMDRSNVDSTRVPVALPREGSRSSQRHTVSTHSCKTTSQILQVAEPCPELRVWCVQASVPAARSWPTRLWAAASCGLAPAPWRSCTSPAGTASLSVQPRYRFRILVRSFESG